MDVFGITPVDSALSALGLNLSQALMDFLFRQSRIGFLSFVAGFLYSVWQCAKNANYRTLITQLAVFITCLLLIASPTRDEGTITSAWEKYGQNAPFSAHDLKAAQTNANTMPVLLSFAGQALDSFAIGAISALSQMMPDYAQYLKYPLGIQEVSLRLHAQALEGINDLKLKKETQDFIYGHYLPALAILKQDQSTGTSLSQYGPSHRSITPYYSPQAQQEWERLKERIRTSIHAPSPFNTWPQAKEILSHFYGQGRAISDDDFIDALVQSETYALAPVKPIQRDWLWQAAGGLVQSYPYAQGWGNLCVYVFFPIVLCLSLIFARAEFLFYYAKSFLWLKSFSFSAALAYFISLMIARAQAQSVTGIQWFWQEPYFALGAGVFVYLMPLMIFFLVCRGINFKAD